MTANWTVKNSDDVNYIATVDDTLVVIWKSTPTIERFQIVENETKILAEQFPDAIRVLVVIQANCNSPGDDFRRRNAELVQTFKNSIEAIAIVIEASGFKAAALRSIINGVFIAARSGPSQKVFKYADSALEWLLNHQRDGEITPDRIRHITEFQNELNRRRTNWANTKTSSQKQMQ